jgi:hypothetical protein
MARLWEQTPNDRQVPPGPAELAGLAARQAMSAKADNKDIGYAAINKYFER